MNKPMTMQSIQWDGMTISIELVTPAIAAAWLTKNSTNRRLRPRAVSAYAAAMTEGDWQMKPMAICFSADGALGNGQHTLSAIVASGVAQSLMIARNVSSKAIAAMDVGLKRSFADIAHFVGKDFSNKIGSMARIIEIGVDDQRILLFDELYRYYEKHQEVIDWVNSLPLSKAHRVGNGAVPMAVCARAAYTRDRDRIAEFVEIMQTGVAKGAPDSAATRLRDFFRSNPGSGANARKVNYHRTQSALDYFLRYQPMTKLYGTDKELFPIPA